MRRFRGVTLLEVIMVVGLLGLLVAMAGQSAPRTMMESRLAAETLAEELRSLRAEAQTKQTATALVIPRSPSGIARGYYCLQGDGPARVIRQTQWQGDFRHVHLVAGTWAGTAAFAPGNQDGQRLDLASWSRPSNTDSVLAFEPNGELLSNLPNWQGKTCLMLATAASVGRQTVGGSSFPRLQQARKLLCVSVDPHGSVNVIEGLPDGSVLPALAGDFVNDQPLNLPGLRAGASGHPPVIAPIQVLPVPSAGLPPGIDASVQVGSYLRFPVQASDPDGGPLLVEWEAERPSGKPDLGKFSHDGPTRMEWSKGQFRAVWEWTPPNDALQREEFLLRCKVSDAEGNVVSKTVGALGKIWALRDGRILFTNYGTSGLGIIQSVNSDGSDLKRLTPTAADAMNPRPSPDGSKILYCAGAGLWVMNRDGSGIRQLVNSTQLGGWFVDVPCWSPDGSRIAFSSRSTPLEVQSKLYIADADGGNLTQVPGTATMPSGQDRHDTISWTFSGASYNRTVTGNQFLIFSPNPQTVADRNVWRISVDGHAAPAPLLPGYSQGCLSPDQHTLAAVSASGELVTFPFLDGAVAGPVKKLGVSGWGPGWSPDQSRLVFTDTSDQVQVMNANGGNQSPVRSMGGTNTDTSWLPGGGAYDQ